VYEKKLNLPVPEDFSFWRTVLSHGWCMLAPFSLDRERRVLTRILKTRRQSVHVEMKAANPDRLEILAQSRQPILSAESHGDPVAGGDYVSLNESTCRIYRHCMRSWRSVDTQSWVATDCHAPFTVRGHHQMI
jgi:hypothetical protein